MKKSIKNPDEVAQSLIDKYTTTVPHEKCELSHAEVMAILKLPEDYAALVLMSAGEAGRWAQGYPIIRAINLRFAKAPATAQAVFDAFSVIG